MRTDRRQDAGMDRLLRTALNGAAGETAEGCPGPDELGGYLEHALPSEEMRAIERHFAACDRCQQVLATLAVMPGDTSETAAADGWWSSHPWRRWLVPAAGIASALILYVALKPQLATESTAPKPLEPSATIAQQLPSTPAPAMAAPAIAIAPSAPPRRRGTPGALASTLTAPPPAAPAPPVSGGHLAAPSAPPAASPEESLAFMRASARADRANAKEEGAAKQAQPDAKQGGATTTSTIVADAANKPPAQPMKAAAEAAPAPVPSGAAMMEMVTVVEPGRAAGKRQAAAPVVLLTASSTRWRLEPRGGISRSTDSGATWQVQRPAGGTVLLAGAAQSATVCWAVGAAGTVLLTTDGSRWNARPFPERVDLVAVTADDGEGLKATVTTRDGRRFATADGGASWVLR